MMNIFKYAMEKEKYSENYYRELAAKTDNKGLRNILNMLADEELKHYRIVEKMKAATPVEIAETSILSNARDVFSRMREAKDTFDFDVGELELYKKAQQFEKNSKQFYEQKAQQVQDPCQKEIFEKLAQEENKHYLLLENIIDFLSRPQTWLENAEFYHLEEY